MKRVDEQHDFKGFRRTMNFEFSRKERNTLWKLGIFILAAGLIGGWWIVDYLERMFVW